MSERVQAPQDAYANLDLHAEHPDAQQTPVRFAFEFPELLAAFEAADAEALRLKARSRLLGILAILLVLAALLIAAAEPILSKLGYHGHEVGYVAAGLGILGTALGLNALRAGSGRRRWLMNRFRAETLRLFHFDYIAAKLPRIVDIRTDEERAAFTAERMAHLGHLLSEMDAIDRREARELLRDPGGRVLAATRIEPVSPKSEAISLIALSALTAWRDLRLVRQRAYCNAKLARVVRGGVMSPRLQERVFSATGWVLVGAVVLLHLLHFGVGFLPSTWLQVAIIWVAMFALAVRALEDGFAPQREVERYEQYRANVTVALERFDGASTLPAKIEVMRGFARLSQEELHLFIRTQAKAHFVL